MAMDLLFDPAVQLISLFGPAGTGKTFLALLAGLHQVLVSDAYQKMLVARPVVPLGRDIGYLPGTLEEKLHSWMMPIFDNMELITHAVSTARHFDEIEGERRRSKKDKKHGDHSKKGRSIGSVEDLIAAGKLSLEAITYMRGRSIPFQFILIDEVQNLTPHEVKTLITRVGEGSKIVLSGDPYQIDSPYLDFSSNGLILANERFKGQDIFGAVYLETSERSPLSEMASRLL
jgi:PhoH-like ATPase